MTGNKNSKRIDKKAILQRVLMATQSLVVYRELQELPVWQGIKGAFIRGY